MRRSLLFVAIAILAVVILLTVAKGPEQVANVEGSAESAAPVAAPSAEAPAGEEAPAAETPAAAPSEQPAAETPAAPATEAPAAPATEAPAGGLAPEVTTTPQQKQ